MTARGDDADAFGVVVGLTGAGYDSIDVSACTKASIQVSNVRSAVDNATADTTLFLLLGALRNFNPQILSLRAGTWDTGDGCDPGYDPQGKLLGILGFGGIGKQVAKRARAMGMRMQFHNRTRPESGMAEDGSAWVGFDELLSTSDAIVLTLPLNVSGLSDTFQ